ncbi:MAG TPA: hypothetical protein VGJ81_14540 [Thermoanaerobaculia bacterium]|jgi:hypothetical protein
MFPEEFADLLNARGKRLLAHPPRFEEFEKRGVTPIVVLDDIVDRKKVDGCVAALDRTMYPALMKMHSPIPREALTKLRENYEEKLKKTSRVRTATLNSGKSRALDAARKIGLAQMMRSESFARFAEAVVGGSLDGKHWGRQVICYGPGDYTGPHNDHHPQSKVARNGFVDVHIMFSNSAVASQLLVYEEHGFLSKTHEVAVPSSVAVYRLPFWHYTTPLLAKRGREAEARRWLLLGSFDYDPPLAKLRYR